MTPSQRDAFCGGKPTLYQRIAGILAPAILLGTIAYIAVIYRTLPDKIPTHYTFSGEIDGWGSKTVLWVTPIIGAVTDLTLWLVGLFPQSWSTGTTVTPWNRTRVFRLVRDLMADLRLGLAAIFAAVTLFTLHAADGFPGWVMTAVTLVTVVLPLLRYFLRLWRKR